MDPTWVHEIQNLRILYGTFTV